MTLDKRELSAAWKAEVKRLEAERDREAELSSVAIARAGLLERRSEQAQAQLDEAVKLLHMSRCIGHDPISNSDFYCWMQMEPEEYCPRCTFLDSLSTVTAEPPS